MRSFDCNMAGYPVEALESYGICISNPQSVKQAFIHASFLNENTRPKLESNERLEFLGDSILDFVVSEYLYTFFPDRREGDLSKIRASLVRESTLAKWAVKLNLGESLLLGKGEEANGGRKRPSILASTFEALLAGLYIDSGIEAVRSLVLPLIEKELEDWKVSAQEHDPKSALLELAGGQHPSKVVFRVVREYGPDHDKRFEVEVIVTGIAGRSIKAKGKGRNRKEAESAASLLALNAIRELRL